MVELHRQNLNNNKKIYNNVLKKLRTKFDNNVPIDHVGSTALPNMYGKNIIDILIGVDDENKMDFYSNIIVELGYFLGNHNSGNYRFFASTKEESKMGDVHIHLVFIDSDRYRDFLILRNYLLSNSVERKAYSDLKRKIIMEGINIREDYKETKSKYVSELLKRARSFYDK